MVNFQVLNKETTEDQSEAPKGNRILKALALLYSRHGQNTTALESIPSTSENCESNDRSLRRYFIARIMECIAASGRIVASVASFVKEVFNGGRGQVQSFCTTPASGIAEVVPEPVDSLKSLAELTLSLGVQNGRRFSPIPQSYYCSVISGGPYRGLGQYPPVVAFKPRFPGFQSCPVALVELEDVEIGNATEEVDQRRRHREAKICACSDEMLDVAALSNDIDGEKCSRQVFP